MLGAMNRDKLRLHLYNARGLIFPSLWLEVSPQIVVEAMRVGTPVVANALNGVATLVMETGTGVAYSDRESLVNSLSVIDRGRDAFSRSARSYYEQEWTPELWLSRMSGLYESLL